MNNEPVAWINREEGSGSILDWEKDPYADTNIPLYTHPHSDKSVKAKTLEPDLYSEDGFPLWTSPQFKTLTDEDYMILGLRFMQWNREQKEPLVKLAYEQYVFEQAIAILRKAQEK